MTNMECHNRWPSHHETCNQEGRSFRHEGVPKGYIDTSKEEEESESE